VAFQGAHLVGRHPAKFLLAAQRLWPLHHPPRRSARQSLLEAQQLTLQQALYRRW